MANSVDPDQMPHSVASNLDLHCMQKPIYPNTSGYYGTIIYASHKCPAMSNTLCDTFCLNLFYAFILQNT